MITLLLMTMIFIACVEKERKEGPYEVISPPPGVNPWLAQ